MERRAYSVLGGKIGRIKVSNMDPAWLAERLTSRENYWASRRGKGEGLQYPEARVTRGTVRTSAEEWMTRCVSDIR